MPALSDDARCSDDLRAAGARRGHPLGPASACSRCPHPLPQAPEVEALRLGAAGRPPADHEVCGRHVTPVVVLGQQRQLAALHSMEPYRPRGGGQRSGQGRAAGARSLPPGGASRRGGRTLAGAPPHTGHADMAARTRLAACTTTPPPQSHLVPVAHELHAVVRVAHQGKVLHHIQAGQQLGAVVEGCKHGRQAGGRTAARVGGRGERLG